MFEQAYDVQVDKNDNKCNKNIKWIVIFIK